MEWSHLWNNVLNHLYIIYIYIYVEKNLIFFVCFPLSHEESCGFFFYITCFPGTLGRMLIWVDAPLLSIFEGHCNPKQGHV